MVIILQWCENASRAPREFRIGRINEMLKFLGARSLDAMLDAVEVLSVLEAECSLLHCSSVEWHA